MICFKRLGKLRLRVLTLAMLLCGAIGAAALAEDRVLAVFTLPKLKLKDVQNRVLPGSLARDREITLGSIGSDLWHGASDRKADFWMVTDRGPNGQLTVARKKRRTFPLPKFAPMILHARVARGEGSAAAVGAISIVEVLPLTGASGRPISGLPNDTQRDEHGFDARGEEPVEINPSGIDAEGLVRTSHGDFWLAEEYGPSLLHVDGTGRVIKRYLPAEQEGVAAPDYPVAMVLPRVYGLRQHNRGFEALAISADETTLYLGMQSPLAAPDKRTARSSRNTRILAFAIAGERPAAEYVYRFEPAEAFEPGAVPDDMKIGAIAALGSGQLLVLERTDKSAKIYRVDLGRATDILRTAWHDRDDGDTLEALDNPAEHQIQVLPKTLIVDLSRLPGIPQKLEGLAVMNPLTIAVANDNDFDLGSLNARGNNVGPGTPSQIIGIRLDRPLY